MKMKAYIYLLSKETAGGLGAHHSKGGFRTLITGRGLKTIRNKKLGIKPLQMM